MELIVKAKDIFLEYAGRDILDIEELEIYSYDRIGLVGDNGAGKTSLLKILSGDLTIAGADVRRFGSIALISQLDELDLDTAPGSGEMLSRLNVAGVAPETMSGGEETRAKIASALSQHASAIFADEPTSHLDQDGISLLVGQLKAFDGALLIVSHDRYFLDQVVDKIWELKDGGISEFWGDYSDYLQQKEKDRKAQATRYEEAMRERDRLEAAIEKQRKKKNLWWHSLELHHQHRSRGKNSGKKHGRSTPNGRVRKKATSMQVDWGIRKQPAQNRRGCTRRLRTWRSASKRSKGSRPQIAFAPCGSARARPWSCTANFPSRQTSSA